MVTLTAPSGPHAGRPIWSCSTYPMCRGMVADDPPSAEPPRSLGALTPRIGRARLLAVGLVVVVILALYVLAPAMFGPT